MPNTLAMNVMVWLSLRGKTSPAPGEDVTIGDKKGNLARERLRGRRPAVLQMLFPVTTPLVKRKFWKIRRFSRIAKYKIIFP